MKKEEVKMTKEQKELLEALDKAKADKDQKLQRKLRKLLRESGYFISKGGQLEEDDLKSWTEKKKERAEKRRKNRQGQKKEKKSSEPTIDDFIRSYFEIDEDTTFEDLKKQYRALCKDNHPDKGGDTEIQQEINAAWEKLQEIYNKK